MLLKEWLQTKGKNEQATFIVEKSTGDARKRMLTEAQKRAKEKYNKKVTKIAIEFYPQDAELLQKVNDQPNKQRYIKELIKKDIR